MQFLRKPLTQHCASLHWLRTMLFSNTWCPYDWMRVPFMINNLTKLCGQCCHAASYLLFFKASSGPAAPHCQHVCIDFSACCFGRCRPYGYPPAGAPPPGMYPPGYMRPGMPAPLYPPQRPGQPPMSMPALRPPPGMALQYPGQPGVGMPPHAGQLPASTPGNHYLNCCCLCSRENLVTPAGWNPCMNACTHLTQTSKRSVTHVSVSAFWRTLITESSDASQTSSMIHADHPICPLPSQSRAFLLGKCLVMPGSITYSCLQ